VSYRIHLRREVPGGPPRRTVSAAAEAALRQARAASSELTVVLTDSSRIRRLNARFAGEDQVTDVLAFPAGEPRRKSPSRYLGDVVVALPRARAQARRRGVPLPHEVSLLTIHGTLHLLGYDHARPAQQRRMWALQAAALRRLGLDPERLEDEV
jgi:probable rRNA maturation factor